MGYRKISLLAAIAFSLPLIGCKATLETVVKASELENKEIKTVNGGIYIEVPSCHSSEDSRIPSESLIKVKDLVAGVFKDSSYSECFSKSMSSYAAFVVPMYIDRTQDGKQESDSHFNIVTNKDSYLGVSIPKSISNEINARMASYIGPQVSMQINIKLVNDTDSEIPVTIMSAYVDGAPSLLNPVKINKGGSPQISLSDVSVSQAMEKGFVNVLYNDAGTEK